MNRLSGFSLVGAVAAFGATAVFAWPFGSDVEAEGVRGPEDLREELRRAQFAAPPGEGLLAYEAGTFPFLPDGSDPDGDRFAEGLLPAAGGNGAWPVTVFEDRETRGTVFLNADGAEILRLPHEPEYSKGWVLDALYPEGGVPADAAAGYDPARVVMAVRLLFPGAFETGDGAGFRAANQAGDVGSAPEQTGKAEGVGAAGESAPDDVSAIGEGRCPSVGRAGERVGEGGAKRDGKRKWYVDSDLGDDSNDGLSAVEKGCGRGPKASVRKAIYKAASGDVIELRGSAAFRGGDLTSEDKDVTLRFCGTVRF